MEVDAIGHNKGKKLGHRPKARAADTLTANPKAEPGEAASELWYVSEGKRAQQLLDSGQAAAAIERFEAVLARLGHAPSYGRAVILERLGRSCHVAGRPDLAVERLRAALDVAGKLSPTDGVRGLRGTVRSELGDALRALGQTGEARKAYEAALKIAEAAHDLRGQAVDLSQLGALALSEGKVEEALARYRAALDLFERLPEPLLETAARHQLGRVLQEARQWDEAERQYREAARISQEHGDLAGAAQSWSRLALLSQECGQSEAAEAWYREGIEADRRIGNAGPLAQRLSSLAGLLQHQAGRLAEARQLAQEALALAQARDSTAAEVWRICGLLGEIAEKESATTADPGARTALETEARVFRELERRGPVLLTTLAGLDEAPSYGRAVILGRIGRCFLLGGRPDQAVVRIRQAVAVAGAVAGGGGRTGLQAALQMELGDALRAAGRQDEATEAYETARELAEATEDLRGQGLALGQLGALALVAGQVDEAVTRGRAALRVLERLDEPALQRLIREQLAIASARAGELPPADEPHLPTLEGTDLLEDLTVTVHEERIIDYAFEPDLLIDGERERRIVRQAEPPPSLATDVRPAVVPSTRTWIDDTGAVRFRLPMSEPLVEQAGGCTVLRRLRRDVTVSGSSTVLWKLMQEMDGVSTVGEVLSAFSPGEREQAGRVLAALAATGVIDLSGRPMGRFLHWATKKGVLPAGGLESEGVLRLATDGDYRQYPQAPRLELDASVPDRLRAFHALTRSRRSHRDYRGLALRRQEFDALLYTACGVTGTMPWGERTVKLRAYPSSGALYAVEVYPVVLRVDGLEPAVYHYRSVEHLLEVVRPGLDPAILFDSALPMEREMVRGAAAMFCLVGSFRRHERKYGEGGYRMLIAEAGHLSENLVLAATALGLSARPFGGVFDDLLNQELGLDGVDEQFLLSVLVGHAGSSQEA